jgi:PEP-CTERM motif
MNDRNGKSAVACAMFCAGLALSLLSEPTRARAEFIGSEVTIIVATDTDTGSWSLNVASPSNPFYWNLSAPVDIMGTSSGEVLATINNLTVALDGDPQAFVVFGVTAGGAPTNFSIASSVVAFAPLINPDAVASASFGVTALTPDGVTATGAYAGGTKVFQARYNGGTTFANLASNLSASAFHSASTSEDYPLAGTIPIVGAVSNIQVEFNFLLTANDLASGTGVFNVVPEPSSIVLAVLGLVGLLCWARRRRLN